MARRIIIALIDAYRAAVSPLMPPTCRYTPTCSRYARTAVQRFGGLKGSWLAVRRLLRCHPLGGGGYDPVPAEPERTGSAASSPEGTAAEPGEPKREIASE